VADGAKAVEHIESKFPGAVVSKGSYQDQHWVEVRLDRLVEICRFLRDDPAWDFKMLLDVTAAHWPLEPQPMQVVYHLYSVSRNDRLRVKACTGDQGPVPTLTGLWASADWNEREAFDMFGIVFEGHPDLRRILMHDDYSDFPLRKEFPLYRG